MLNVIALVGRLTRDPELRRTNSGNSVAAFTIACDNPRKGPNGEKETLFMDCSVFGPQADTVVKFFSKGSGIAVYGRLVSRKYVNKQGVNVTAYSVTCDTVEFNDLATKGKEDPEDGPLESAGSLDGEEYGDSRETVKKLAAKPAYKFDPQTGKPLTGDNKRK